MVEEEVSYELFPASQSSGEKKAAVRKGCRVQVHVAFAALLCSVLCSTQDFAGKCDAQAAPGELTPATLVTFLQVAWVKQKGLICA
ncbi:hypothetical protein GN956_G12034 [Arapaima gigas]